MYRGALGDSVLAEAEVVLLNRPVHVWVPATSVDKRARGMVFPTALVVSEGRVPRWGFPSFARLNQAEDLFSTRRSAVTTSRIAPSAEIQS